MKRAWFWCGSKKEKKQWHVVDCAIKWSQAFPSRPARTSAFNSCYRNSLTVLVKKVKKTSSKIWELIPNPKFVRWKCGEFQALGCAQSTSPVGDLHKVKKGCHSGRYVVHTSPIQEVKRPYLVILLWHRLSYYQSQSKTSGGIISRSWSNEGRSLCQKLHPEVAVKDSWMQYIVVLK